MRAAKALVLAAVLGAACLSAGCQVVSSQSLLATLPLSAAGVTFDQSRVIDDSFMSGYMGDDVLAALGKRRSDASMVDRFSNLVHGQIGAMAVSGTSGEVLLRTVVETWSAPAVVARSEATIGDRDVWVLELRASGFFLAYQRGSIVYWASADDRSFAEQLVAALP